MQFNGLGTVYYLLGKGGWVIFRYFMLLSYQLLTGLLNINFFH